MASMLATYAAVVAERGVPASPASTLARLARLAFTAELAVHRGLSAAARRAGWSASILPYPGYGGGGKVRVLGRVLLVPAGTDTGSWPDVPGWRRFLTLEQPDAEVRVAVGGGRRTVRSDAAGHIDAAVDVSLPPGRADAWLSTGQRPPVTAPVYVASPAPPHGVVCDIDDTVWVTGLRHPVRAAWRTFVEASSGRRPVPGMAALLRGLVGDGHAPVIYLSTGPWNLAGAIVQFLARHDFPPGALLLTDWGFTPRGWFRDGRVHKRDALVRVAHDLPGVRWVLVGDDGQHDPEIYAEFARRFPDRVAAIALRKVAPGARLLESLQPLPRSRPTRTPQAQDAGAVPVVHAATGQRLLQLVEPCLGSPVICRARQADAAAG